MNNLIFKESFDWDKRFINEEVKDEHSNPFCKGLICGIGLTLIIGLALTLINML